MIRLSAQEVGTLYYLGKDVESKVACLNSYTYSPQCHRVVNTGVEVTIVYGINAPGESTC